MTEPNIFGIKVAWIVAGFFGAVCSLSFLPSMNLWQRITAVCVGSCSATFLGPAVAEVANASDKGTAAIIWVIGLIAMGAMPAFFAVAATVPKDLWDIARKKLGGEK